MVWKPFQKFQFPYESVFTIKDLLSAVCRRLPSNGKLAELSNLETSPKWYPTTYNLKTELPQFVSFFQHREERGLDNHWICKPWNLARGMDTYITDNLNCIVRLPTTGPKVTKINFRSILFKLQYFMSIGGSEFFF